MSRRNNIITDSMATLIHKAGYSESEPFQTTNEPQPGDSIYCSNDHCHRISSAPGREHNPHNTITTINNNHSVSSPVDIYQYAQYAHQLEDIDVQAIMEKSEALRVQVEWLWQEQTNMRSLYQEDANKLHEKIQDLGQDKEILQGFLKQDEKTIMEFEEQNGILRAKVTELRALVRHIRDGYEKDNTNRKKRIAALENDKKMATQTSGSEREMLKSEISRLKASERYMRDECEKNKDKSNKMIKALEIDNMIRLASQSEISRLQQQVDHLKRNSAACVPNTCDRLAPISGLETTLTYQTAQTTGLKEILEAEMGSKLEEETKAALYQEELEQLEVANPQETTMMKSIIEDFDIRTLIYQVALEAGDGIIRNPEEKAAILIKKLEQRRRDTSARSNVVLEVLQNQQRRLQEIEQQEKERRRGRAVCGVAVSKVFRDQKRRLERLEQLNEIARAQLQSARVPLEKSMSLMDKLEALSKSPRNKTNGRGDGYEEGNVEDFGMGTEETRLEVNSEKHTRSLRRRMAMGMDDYPSTSEPIKPEYVIIDRRNGLRAWNGKII
jgi:hypothetical protein